MISAALKWFLFAYILFFISALVILSVIDKGEWVIFLNQNRTTSLDYFFAYWTHLGDGIFAGLLVIAMLFVKYRYAIVAGITVLFVALVSAVFKFLIYTNSPRPKKYLSGIYELDLIDWVNVHSNHSFPSGHTTLAFSIAVFLTMISKQKIWGLVFFTYALLVGISRNYLSQHFLEDITAGSMVGLVLGLSIWMIFRKKHQADWLGNRLFSK